MKLRKPDAGQILLYIYCGAVFCFLAAPIAILFITSFTAGETVAFPPEGLSVRWYLKVFDHLRDAPGEKPGLALALGLSLKIGAIVALLTSVAGVLAALVLYRHNFFGIELLRQYFVLPLMFPHIVTGTALLVLFSQFKIGQGEIRLTFGHMLLALPYVITIVGAALQTMNPRLEEAAVGLGASGWKAFFLVTLPQIRPSVAAGAVFAFMTSFTAFTVSYFLYSVDAQPLPVWLYEYMAYYVSPMLAALSTVLILVSVVAIFVIDRLVGIGRIAKRE